MSGAVFKYVLEPVRLTRQWSLEALLGELGEHNARVALQESCVAGLEARLATSAEHWAVLTDPANTLTLQNLALLSRYAGDCAAQLAQACATRDEFARERDALSERVMQSRRALDALERHRDKQEAVFVQARMSGEFKLADEQWNTRQEGVSAHDNPV